MAASSSIVRVTINESLDASNALEYVSHVPSNLMISPSVGIAGDIINVTGTGFRDGPSLVCRFGTVLSTQTTFVSTNLVLCVAPALDIGYPVVVSVGYNGVDYVSSIPLFVYLGGPSAVNQIRPGNIGSLSGGTVLSLTGSGFPSATFCVFGSGGRRSPAKVSSSTHATCLSPSSDRVQTNIPVTLGDNDAVGAATFSYVEIPFVSSISPLRVPGGSPVLLTVTGSNFTTYSCCAINNNLVVPLFVSSTTVICSTAPTYFQRIAVGVSPNCLDLPANGSLRILEVGLCVFVHVMKAEDICPGLYGSAHHLVFP